MGHSRQSLAALLDLHLFRPGGEVEMTIGGAPVRVRRLFGVYPMKFLLAQTQGGLAIADFRQSFGQSDRQSSQGAGFRLVRPGDAAAWPTRAEETWTWADGWARHDGPLVSTRYHFVDGELDRAQAWQVGVDVPVTDIAFNPRVPDLRRPFTGTVASAFAADIAGQPGHGTGAVSCRWEGDAARCELRPSKPHWFADRPMDARITYDADGSVLVRVERVDSAVR
jgi:hypothetical protein